MATGTCKTCKYWDDSLPIPKYYFDDYQLSSEAEYNGTCLLFSNQLYGEEKGKAPIPLAFAGDDDGTLGCLYTSQDFRCGHYNKCVMAC